MPIYSYRCDHCGLQFDLYQKFNDEPLKVCPECERTTIRKLYHPVGIVYKGSGFYSTDHRSPSGQTKAKKSEDSKESPKESKESTEKNSSSTSEDWERNIPRSKILWFFTRSLLITIFLWLSPYYFDCSKSLSLERLKPNLYFVLPRMKDYAGPIIQGSITCHSRVLLFDLEWHEWCPTQLTTNLPSPQ